tara:strand:+ start:588 stop:788 length:201 start_codon:yes stop_codon:yes gene_type:complete
VNKENLKARKKAERRSKMMTRMANRTFSKDPKFLDRMAMRTLQKRVRSAPVDDPELDHDGPINPFE